MCVVVVGVVAVPIAVHARIEIPNKRALLAHAVGGVGGVKGDGFSQRNFTAAVVNDDRREWWSELEADRHAKRLCAVSTAKRRVGVVNHQQQFLALERRADLPSEGL